jgi:hypothetical protein
VIPDTDEAPPPPLAQWLTLDLGLCTELLARVIIDRAVFYRENASRTYNSMAYAITMIIVEWPFCLAAAVLYVYALSA